MLRWYLDVDAAGMQPGSRPGMHALSCRGYKLPSSSELMSAPLRHHAATVRGLSGPCAARPALVDLLVNWLHLVGAPDSGSSRRRFITNQRSEYSPLTTTTAFLRSHIQQGWLPYRAPHGRRPEPSRKPSSRGRYQMSQSLERGSPFSGSRVEGELVWACRYDDDVG